MEIRVVGRYELVRELGHGGMSTVYLARQRDLDRLAALKELDSLRTLDPSFTQRFLREARLAGSLSHPNIVTVYDYFEENRVPYIAMEFVELGSLRPHVGALTPAQIGGVLEDVLAGLAYAEKSGIVHRDLKPENFLISAEGRVKIADFGIAKATNTVRTTAFLTTAGTTMGTPNYMAPEQAMAKEIGPWTDLYSLGVVAYELFVGRPPFGDTDEPMAVLMRQVNEPIRSVREARPDVDPRIAGWIASLVAKDPLQRPQTAADAWDELERALDAALGTGWRRGAGLVERHDRPARTPATVAILPDLQPTVPPRGGAVAAPPPPLPPAPPAEARGGRRRRPVLLTAVAAGLATAGVLAALGYSDNSERPYLSSGPAATTQSAAPTTATAETVASAPAPLGAELAEAQRLAAKYDASADKVASLRGGSGAARARLVAALRTTADAYRAAAAAAGRGDVGAYAAAIARAGDAKRDVSTALSALGASRSEEGEEGGAGEEGSSDSSDVGDSRSDDPSDDGPEP
jgi:predicted Ser/Thr protein kinase